MADAADLDALDVPSRISQRQEILAHADIKALVGAIPGPPGADTGLHRRPDPGGASRDRDPGPCHQEGLRRHCRQASGVPELQARAPRGPGQVPAADPPGAGRCKDRCLPGRGEDPVGQGLVRFHQARPEGCELPYPARPGRLRRARMADLRGGVLRRPDAARRAPDLPASPGRGHPAPASGISGRPCRRGRDRQAAASHPRRTGPDPGIAGHQPRL